MKVERIGNITTAEEYAQAWYLYQKEYPEYKDTDLLKEYEWILIATKKSNVVGIITANKYTPKKALVCNIITRSKHESELLSEELLRGLGTLLRRQGYTQILLAQDLKLVLDLRN